MLSLIARILGGIFSTIVPVAIIIAAVWGAKWLIENRTEVPKTEYERKAFEVEVQTTQAAAAQVIFEGFGTVKPHRRVSLQSEVPGRVLRIHPNLVLGGLIDAKDEVIAIDDREMKLLAEAADGEIARAEFELTLEKGQGAVAEESWKMLEGSVPESSLGRDLALRLPHIKEKKAALAAAISRKNKNLLDIERCQIHAPFNALVTEENVEVGELMSVRSSVAGLVCTDAFHVETTLPLHELELVSRRLQAGEEPIVKVIQDIGQGKEVQFTGRVFKLLGALEAETRLARLLIEVEDPLRLKPANRGKLPLLLGAYVRVSIEGPALSEVVSIPREWIRDQDTVWLVDQDARLEIRKVVIADRRRATVIVSEGLEANERVVTSSIATALAGMKLKVLERPSPKINDGEAQR